MRSELGSAAHVTAPSRLPFRNRRKQKRPRSGDEAVAGSAGRLLRRRGCEHHRATAFICQRRMLELIYRLSLWNSGSCGTSSRSPTSGTSRAPRRASTSPSRRSRSRSAGSSARSAWRSSSGLRGASRSPRPGEVLVARARRILSEVDAANAEMQALAGIRSGHVSVGTMHTMGPVDVSLALALFHRAPSWRRAHGPRAVERGARGDAPRRRARPRVPVGDRADREPGAGAPSARLRGARGGSPARPPARRSAAGADGRARRRAVRQLPGGRAAARAADVRGPSAPGSSRRSSSSRTRASGSGGSWRAAWVSRSSPARTPTGPLGTSPSRRWSSPRSGATSRSRAAKGGVCPRPRPSSCELSKELFANESAEGDAPTAAPSRSDRRANTAGPRPPVGRRAER